MTTPHPAISEAREGVTALIQCAKRYTEQSAKTDESLEKRAETVRHALDLAEFQTAEIERIRTEAFKHLANYESAANERDSLTAQVARLTAERDDYKTAYEDTRRLAREIDQAMHGEDAAQQASLCDLIVPAQRMRAERDRLKAALTQIRARYSPDGYDVEAKIIDQALGITAPQRSSRNALEEG